MNGDQMDLRFGVVRHDGRWFGYCEAKKDGEVSHEATCKHPDLVGHSTRQDAVACMNAWIARLTNQLSGDGMFVAYLGQGAMN